jgi:ketol-acid reductoisomerase
MARVFKDTDADLGRLDGRTVAVIGYGNQGRSQALNLRDSGVDVIVGNRGDAYRQVASNDGLQAHNIPEATARGDIVMVVLPDETQAEVLPEQVFPHLKGDATVTFAHGYSVHFGEVEVPSGHDVGLVAPKMIGPSVRSLFERGVGFPSIVAVHSDVSGEAWDTVLAVAKGIGSTRLGAWKSTFEEETITDLFGEQGGGSGAIVGFLQAFRVLVEAGYDPEVVQLEMLGSGELVEVAKLQAEQGIVDSLSAHSPTSQFGHLYRAHQLLGKSSADHFRRVLQELQDGTFAKTWREEREGGYRQLERLRTEFGEEEFVAVSQRNRQHMRGVFGSEEG